jgi:hypothetical protein
VAVQRSAKTSRCDSKAYQAGLHSLNCSLKAPLARPVPASFVVKILQRPLSPCPCLLSPALKSLRRVLLSQHPARRLTLRILKLPWIRVRIALILQRGCDRRQVYSA